MLNPILLAVAFLPFAMGQLVNEEGIRPQSSLEITIEGVPQNEKGRLNAVYPIGKDGSIVMWKIGAIKAKGKSFEELAKDIAAAYREAEIYDRAVFTVRNKQPVQTGCGPRLKRFSGVDILGRVKTAGRYEWKDGETFENALKKAGGATVYGATNRIKLYRNGQVYTYNMEIKKHRGVKIYNSDTIEVPQKSITGR